MHRFIFKIQIVGGNLAGFDDDQHKNLGTNLIRSSFKGKINTHYLSLMHSFSITISLTLSVCLSLTLSLFPFLLPSLFSSLSLSLTQTQLHSFASGFSIVVVSCLSNTELAWLVINNAFFRMSKFSLNYRFVSNVQLCCNQLLSDVITSATNSKEENESIFSSIRQQLAICQIRSVNLT